MVRSELGRGKGVISRANPQRQVPPLASCSSANSFSPKLRLLKKKKIYIYIYIHTHTHIYTHIYLFGYAVFLLWNVRSSSLTRDGIQALGAGTLSPWTTREVLLHLFLKAVLPVPLWAPRVPCPTLCNCTLHFAMWWVTHPGESLLREFLEARDCLNHLQMLIAFFMPGTP